VAEASDARQVEGQGVTARVNGRSFTAGRAELFGEAAGGNGLAEAVAQVSGRGCSIVVVGREQTPIGVIGLSDRPRTTAAGMLQQLKAIGVRRTIMLTGDKTPAAQAIASQVGIDEYHAELLPQQKLDLVRALERRYGPIAMVGDGVNDAPALATATVGIAMGGAGTDVAIETADVALMADDLSRLPAAIGLSRFSRRIIAQNLVIALGVISVLAPLSALGYTYLGVAVLFHEGSTVVVVLNSMRLLFYKSR
jgi:Cd2+/Zn2+-exporting ATPase